MYTYTHVYIYTLQHMNRSSGRATLLQHPATPCNTSHPTRKKGDLGELAATHCNTLQHVTIHCNTLQHTATHLTQHAKRAISANWPSQRDLTGRGPALRAYSRTQRAPHLDSAVFRRGVARLLQRLPRRCCSPVHIHLSYIVVAAVG